MRKIVLIGYRGSGKSTVGRLLAQACGLDFVDTDREIERRAGRTIAEIFAADGEAGFRAIEREVIAEFADRTGLVLSVGGGAVLDAENVRRMRAGGVVVWLKAPAEELWRRIQGDADTAVNRPALTGGGLEEVVEVLGRREGLYRDAADHVVETGGKAAAVVCGEIVGMI